MGIAAADMERIFDEFERLDNQPSDQEKGIGLGLAIARRISKVLGHQITVRSTPGKGTVFALEVPIAQPHEVAVLQQAQPLPAGKSQGQVIEGMSLLCIDNDNNVLNAMTTVLEGWGCRVVAATSYETARQAISDKQQMPDAMLVDYHLDAGETGVKTMNALQTLFSTPVPGVLITADMSEAIKNEAAESGYRELRKPVNPGALRNLLFKFYQQRRFRNERIG